MYKYIVFAVLIYGISCVPQTRRRSASQSQKNCSNEAVFEDCIHQLLMIGGPVKQLPNNTQQITAFCGKLKDANTCVKDYTKRCLTPVGRRATEVAIAGIARMAKGLCKSNAKKQEFAKNAKCGNAVLGDMRSCLGEYRLALHGAVASQVSQRLPILCCKFYDFRGCVRKGFERVGPQMCPSEAQAYYARVADSFQSDVFDLICSDYDEGSDKCKSVVVPPVTESAKTRSLFTPLREIIKSILDENQQ